MHDYAKKRSHYKQRKVSRGHRLNHVLLLLALILVGFAAFHFIHKQVHVVSTPKSIVKTQEPVAHFHLPLTPHKKEEKPTKTVKKIISHIKTAAVDNQPKYDFYQLLPKMTVTIPHRSTTNGSNTTSR